MLTAWRLVHKRKVNEAFTGTGSRRYGGRWNYKGIGVVYVSDSLALAALEIIVHAASYQALRDYVRNVDELTSTSRRTDLGRICLISDHKS